MPELAPESRRAFAEVRAVLDAMERKLVEGPSALREEADLLDGYRWIPSLLQVAMQAYVWADPAWPRFVDIVGPTLKWGGDNSDASYRHAALDPARRYRVRGRRGDAVYLSLTVYGGPRDGGPSNRIVGARNDRELAIDPDGSFAVELSPDADPERPNALRLEPDAVCAITRDYLHDPVRGRRADWEIECLDPSPPPRLTDGELAGRLRAAASFLRDQLSFVPLSLPPPNTIRDPYPVPPVTRGWAAGDAAYAMGSFELDADRALVVRGRSPRCVFWNLCLWNPFLHTFDYGAERVTINGGQVRLEEDGSWTVVVSVRDPGHPNWVSTAGRRSGLVWLRWFLPESTPEPLDVAVVPLAQVPPGPRK